MAYQMLRQNIQKLLLLLLLLLVKHYYSHLNTMLLLRAQKQYFEPEGVHGILFNNIQLQNKKKIKILF